LTRAKKCATKAVAKNGTSATLIQPNAVDSATVKSTSQQILPTAPETANAVASTSQQLLIPQMRAQMLSKNANKTKKSLSQYVKDWIEKKEKSTIGLSMTVL
jgi:hypothetical protein